MNRSVLWVFIIACLQPESRAQQGGDDAMRTSPPRPMLITDRSLERTGFQEASPYDPRYDLRTDFVMSYGIGKDATERLKDWIEAGYVPQIMTGVAWGGYQDYLDGKVDGREHWDEGQVDAKGNPINHGPTVPYMVPTISFATYLEKGIRDVIDAGAVAVHLEEPEFWARGGFSEAFKREWQIYYNEPWERPDSSCDAQYRASKLKHFLYRRTLDRLCSAMKEHAWVSQERPVRFYVPTHSLLNYTQWNIVSPESALLDLPGVDGYIAQIWTGTARSGNIYQGQMTQRTFDTAYLEYGTMQELVRGTGRRMWFLHDPIEDNPIYDWEDYRKNYICTLIASLLHPAVSNYEVSPWPNRVFMGSYPAGSDKAQPIPQDYATTLAVVFNQLRDMDQKEISWPEATEGVGVFLADSAMFQRAEPAFSSGLATKPSDMTRPSGAEVRSLAAFYGMALPPLKRGIPIRPVQLDNVARFPGYLDAYKVLLLSYEFMKPANPGIHLALAQWVERGGSLIYVGADTDPFHAVRDWWTEAAKPYKSPSEHLFESLGLKRYPKAGTFSCGKGKCFVIRQHPAAFSRSEDKAEELMGIVKDAVKDAGGAYIERSSLQLKRGPYVIAAGLTESISEAPLKMKGVFIDLLQADLPVIKEVSVAPGQQCLLLDLKKVRGAAAIPLAYAGRIEDWRLERDRVAFRVSTLEGISSTGRILLPSPPKSVTVSGQPCSDMQWDALSKTLFLRHPGHAKGDEVVIEWTP